MKSLLSLLLNRSASLADREEAACGLGEFDEAESALIELAQNSDEDRAILASCGASIAEIWHRKDVFDQDVLSTLTLPARSELIDYLRDLKFRVSLDQKALKDLDLSGRPFLHQQGRSITRGFVTQFEVKDDEWVLDLKRVEYLNRETNNWELKYPEDQYAGQIDRHWGVTWYKDTDLFEVPGYGFVTYVGPQVASPWTEIEWPPTDDFPGGKMG